MESRLQFAIAYQERLPVAKLLVMHSAIRLSNIHKSFGDVNAVTGIDLEVAHGEFFAMLGPSGSGKTTVLKSVLINVILTQQFGCGFYDSAKLKPYKYIHCYLNIPDTSGRDSLFQAEARRCKEILDIIKESPKSEEHFCVFDELYSGTNPEEAVMSSLAFMEYLAGFKNVNSILTTHFIQVCKKLNSNKSDDMKYCMNKFVNTDVIH